MTNDATQTPLPRQTLGFLCNLLESHGIEPKNKSFAVGDTLRRGQTVQFLVRDAESASEDLTQLMRLHAALYELIEKLRDRRKLNSRVAMPLFEAALGLTMTNSRYQALAEVEANLASRDLKMLVSAGLLIPAHEL